MDQLIEQSTYNHAIKLGVKLGDELPTQTYTMKVLREEYGFVISPKYTYRMVKTPQNATRVFGWVASYYYVVGTITKIKGLDIVGCRKRCTTMEDAYEEGIRKCLARIEEDKELE